MAEPDEDRDQAGKLFESFIQASTCKGALQSFNLLCRQLDLDPLDHETFYSSLKAKLTSWRAKALWSKLDKRTCHKEYRKGQACLGTKCLIIGGGPCGLRTAIELALLGAKVVVIEKRDTFSRNNVLHLWPYTIHDLRGLGAKKFYGKFCAGAIDHISIRQLQLMLLKIALLVAVEFHVNVEFVKLLEPPEDQENAGPGWRAEIRPADHPVADFDFDVVVGADGRRNTLEGFKRKEFRGKLAIAITANFINRNTTAEAKVEEISGVAFIFNQKFFHDLKEETGVDLENIVYYKDKTHYFVMTAKKQSLLDKGVIIHDYIDTEMLLSSENVNQEALLGYAREAADFGTNYQLPTLDYAMNHCGQPDVAMFDFTSMYASENAAQVRDRFGHQLLVTLVGDSLLEPFWPMGTGCARGFLAAFDTAWMVKSWAQGRSPLEVLAERESLYRLLPQTTPENIAKNFEQYTLDPGTRYPNLNSSCVRPHQVRHLYLNGELKSCSLERAATIRRPVNLARRESEIRPGRLLTWCQKQTEGYRNVEVTDLTSSWSTGMSLCALIHRVRPQLIDFDSLNVEDVAENLQLAFDVAEREFGVRPFTSGKLLAGGQEIDKPSMVFYLSKFYELFRGTPLPASDSKGADENTEDLPSKAVHGFNKALNFTLPRKRVPKDDKKLEDTDPTKRRRKVGSYLEEATLSSQSGSSGGEGREPKENKVRSMATQLLAKFEESNPSCSLRRQSESVLGSGRSPRPRSLDMTETPRFINLAQPSPLAPPIQRQGSSATCVQYVNLVKLPPHHRTKPPPPRPPPKPQLQPELQAQLQLQLQLLSQPQPQLQPQLPLQPSCKSPPSPKHALRKIQKDDKSRSQSQSELESPDYPGYSPSCHSAVLAMSRMLQRLQEVEEQITQKKAQTQHAREFLKKSVKEKAVHLKALVSGDPTSTPESQASKCQGLDMQFSKKATLRAPLNQSLVRTVGKVSLAIGARAEALVSLYDNDHRPKASLSSPPCSPPSSPLTSPGSLRREFPQSGDKCHFCERRVYVVERISAEGLYFHRECFRCDTCGSALRQGGHAFDSEQGKLYCKLHFTQRKNGIIKPRTFNSHSIQNGMAVREGTTSQTSNGVAPQMTDNTQSQSAGTLSSRLRKSLSWPLSVTRAVCDSPRRLSHWLHGTARTLGVHLRANAQDYAFLYELLTLGLPLLFSMQEVLLQMYTEAGPGPGPGALTLQPVLLWLEEQLGQRLI
ncbi:F-actin-monooxygenase mical2b isoform X4 [Osmerus eperlanus]|uniref:F-actin-monooxygenase mical2b isoform X4 n=1 Tax=Osmerus eperlanus TaxID=29151 RepID=UPI002E0FBA60